MKKILFLVISLGLLFTASGQVAVMANPNGLTLDTVTNTGSEGPTITLKGFASTASFVLEVTKISGTVAGTAILQGSNRANTAAAFADIDTVTLADASQTVQFTDSPKQFQYYRVLLTGTGTMSASYRAVAYTSKQ